MSLSLEKWIENHVKKYKDIPNNILSEILFHRDESRSNFVNSDYFYSPADGIILYQEIVDNKSPLEIKGKYYTLPKILGDDTFNKKCLVIGIFMTFYDVHINRIPYSGILSFKELDPIISANFPMLATEKGLFDGDKRYEIKGMDYVFYNERMVNKIYNPIKDFTYYVVQIADEEVDLIVPFTTKQKDYFAQNDRFSIIRYGSQCELVIPLLDKYEFSLLEKTWNHVEAGIDKLVEIKNK